MKLSALLALGIVGLASAFPSDYLSFASWDIEGYAKNNPIGKTTGGKGGPTVWVDTAEKLQAELQGSDPKIIRVKGHVDLPSRLKIGSNKSIIGVGWSTLITGSGIDIFDGDNVILQNVKISKIVGEDAVTIRNFTRVWVDHNEFESELSTDLGPDYYDGQLDIIRASDWITVSFNKFHNHWKCSLVGNNPEFRDLDSGKLHITYHHNYWHNMGTRGPSGRFGHQHIYNNFYEKFNYQAIHSRTDNQVLVEGNVFRETRTALQTYCLVIPEDSPDMLGCGDYEIDGFANLGAKNDWGGAFINVTQVGNFTEADYKYKLTPLPLVPLVAKLGAGIGRIL